MADTKHPEHAHLKDLYGANSDPSTPPADKLRFDVLRVANRWKPKNSDPLISEGQATANAARHVPE
ncbi:MULTISPECIES: hypothetical protein [unclassified Phaeobacter]|uniref:hypothetical protein n=1 Tax=unclassified Phaeobacter TaxID=2621772 RepID=UPI003A87AD71